MKKNPYEGLQENVKRLKSPAIDVWRNKYDDRDYEIKIDMPEFTCVCPKTGLPDFALIIIRYVPDKWCIELKSLKYYELFYRNLGIFHENVVNKMLNDLVKACEPRWMEITGEFNARGGIKTTVKAEHKSSTAYGVQRTA